MDSSVIGANKILAVNFLHVYPPRDGFTDHHTDFPSSPRTDGTDLPEFSLKDFLQKYVLQLSCFTLHVGLVFCHIVLLILGTRHWEYQFTFPLDQEKSVSFKATVIATGLGTIYCSGLVFLTQRLAMRHNIQTEQTLTATHDSISAWAGLGSALSTLYKQASVPSSIFGTLSIFGYLGCIAMLHITIPTSFSVAAFNTTSPISASTHGIPSFGDDSSLKFLNTFPAQFLEWHNIFFESETPGLFNSSIYEVLQEVTSSKGEAPVSIVGFNISCGYLQGVFKGMSEDRYSIWLDTVGSLDLKLYPNMLSFLQLKQMSRYRPPQDDMHSLVVYTTNMVIDSQGFQGSPIHIPEGNKISQVQFLRCSKSLVVQSGLIQSESGVLNGSSLHPSLYKTNSHWRSSAVMDFVSQDSTLLGGNWVGSGYPAGYPAGNTAGNPAGNPAGNVPQYVMKSLNGPILKLHEIENTLANSIALIFWIVILHAQGGHVSPDVLVAKYATRITYQFQPGYIQGIPPELPSGTTTVQLQTTIARLRVSIGLASSALLMMLCIKFLAPTQSKVLVQGCGILDNIWLWRNQVNCPVVLRVGHGYGSTRRG
ncbi:hypothetical protein GGX14DRAFT_659563 [Mycena pura]|uniref:Uncharacterized protein n=1 Tax=Mycena pura TaxID=153505 RepID=A0AAD6V6E3_9AGAR|nr:hypothetical protein GGX14DRAFT_659563 [Mycena pura]